MKIRNIFTASIFKKIFLGYIVIIIIYVATSAISFRQLNKVKRLSEKVVPLTLQVEVLYELISSLKILETYIDKFFVVGHIEYQEKANFQLKEMTEVIKKFREYPDKAMIKLMMDIKVEIFQLREDLLSLSVLRQGHVRSREINEKIISLYDHINLAYHKSNKLVSIIVAFLQTHAQQEEEVVSMVINQFIITGVFILLIGLMLSFLLSRAVSRPIRRLNAATIEIGKGKLDVPIGITSKDEIGELALAFNYMAKQINSREKSLNSVNRRLEDEIAEHKRAVEALRESEEKYRGIFENAVEGIFQSTQDGRYISVNPALARIIGYDSPAEMIENVTDIAQQLYVDPAQQDELIRLCKQDLVFNFEEQLYRKDGSKIWVSVNARPTFDETGNLIGIEGIILDITEQKKSEEKIKNYSKRLEEMVEERTKALKNAQEQLVRQEKLAVIGQLASGVGHELRNPIGVISNSIYYLNMKLKDVDDKTKKHLDILQREVLRTNTIITDLLDFSRIKPPAFEEADLNNIVKETISITEVPENITLETKLDEKLHRISVDADQIRRVIMNIASNAVGAMPEGGRLAIKTVVKKDFVEITFKDTGEGISKENLQKIFEPLFTTKAKGIGLGLAIVKGIVEGHKGEIEVESEVGKGSTFIIKLPAQSKEALR